MAQSEKCPAHPNRDKAWPHAVGCKECCEQRLRQATVDKEGPNDGCGEWA